MILPEIRDYDQLCAAFRWQIPERYNIGVDVCEYWAKAEPERPAIFDVAQDGGISTVSYGALRRDANRLASSLVRLGVRRGDRVAILLPQMSEVAIAHIASYRIGAIVLPLASLFGVDALVYRMSDAGVRALVTNSAGLAKVAAIRDQLPGLELLISVDGEEGDALDYRRLLAEGDEGFAPVDTSADDPALMIYTSGTTGLAKGALHAHRVLPGHFPGVQLPHEFFPQPDDLMWTPADWAWAGGLLNVLLPSLRFGVPVVARKFDRFDPEAAFELIARTKIRNAFVPPTALRMLRSVEAPRKHFNLALRTLASGGEALGSETYAWGRRELGLTINEFYGQTECNLIVGSCAAIGISKAGAIGRTIPGHTVGIIREDGSICDIGETGQIAVKRPDPVMFLGYWNKPVETAEKFIGDWMTTGDQGYSDTEGYVHFIGRDDDVITSSGYRIGPVEIEDCLLRHPAIALAAVVGKPDPLRTEIVKAFVVLKEGVTESDALTQDIKSYVRTQLSAHEYPREIAYVRELPLTTTGKVIRRLLRDQN